MNSLVITIVLLSQVITSAQRKGAASIAIFLATSGAEFTIKNASGQNPLDLCSDPSLLKLLKRCHQEHHAGRKQSTESQEEPKHDQCLVCGQTQRQMVFIPCGHVTSCDSCSKRSSNCQLCDALVTGMHKVRRWLVQFDICWLVFAQKCIAVTKPLIGKFFFTFKILHGLLTTIYVHILAVKSLSLAYKANGSRIWSYS